MNCTGFKSVILRYSEGSRFHREAAKSFAVPQDDGLGMDRFMFGRRNLPANFSHSWLVMQGLLLQAARPIRSAASKVATCSARIVAWSQSGKRQPLSAGAERPYAVDT